MTTRRAARGSRVLGRGRLEGGPKDSSIFTALKCSRESAIRAGAAVGAADGAC